MGHLYHGYVSHNQRVVPRSPCGWRCWTAAAVVPGDLQSWTHWTEAHWQLPEIQLENLGNLRNPIVEISYCKLIPFGMFGIKSQKSGAQPTTPGPWYRMAAAIVLRRRRASHGVVRGPHCDGLHLGLRLQAMGTIWQSSLKGNKP
jgi:hypothetical protein